MDTTWDQRIPNEPIFERNFLLSRPVIIPQGRANNTDGCASDQPWLLLTRAKEKEMANWWNVNVKSNGNFTTESNDCIKKGLPINTEHQPIKVSLRKLIKMYPDRPWLKGIHIDISTDNCVRNLGYYNPKDCISDNVQLNDRLTDQAFIMKMQQANQRPIDESRLWNNVTSPRMLEPY